MGNIDPRSTVIYDDADKRIIRVDVVDLEANICLSDTVVISKTVERTFLKAGETAISQRLNSYNKVVYLRAATDDEVLPKQNSAVSKSLRNGILRLLPGDIQDECKAKIIKIRDGETPKDPKARQRRIIDTFKVMGVSVSDLEELLGHTIDSCSPKEFEDLFSLYHNIKAGEASFHAELAAVTAEREGTPEKESTMDKLKKKHGKKKDDKAETVDKETGEVTSG